MGEERNMITRTIAAAAANFCGPNKNVDCCLSDFLAPSPGRRNGGKPSLVAFQVISSSEYYGWDSNIA